MMEVIHIAIVEDDFSYQASLKGYLETFENEFNKEFIIDVFSSGESFLKDFSRGLYQIIFLDVELDKIDGLDVAREVRKKDNDVVIIFETNMAQYALDGYSVDALDFIVKPYNYEYIKLKTIKALKNIKDDRRITINTTDKKIVTLDVNDIYYVEVNLHYLLYHTTNGIFKVRGKMKDAEEDLFSSYFRLCNSCFLVNLKYVEMIDLNYCVVNKENLLISRRRRQYILDEYAKYVGR